MNNVEPTVVIIIEQEIDKGEWLPYGNHYQPDELCVARAFLKDARRQYTDRKFRMYFFNRGKEIIVE